MRTTRASALRQPAPDPGQRAVRGGWAPPLLGRLGLLGLMLLGALGAPVAGADPGAAPVTLSIQQMRLREVLALLAESRNLNIVCSAEADALVSIELREVPFDEALEAVVAVAGCRVTQRGSIYFVERGDGEAEPPGGREVRSFRLDHADPEKLQAVISQSLSPTGQVTPYPPLRALVVEDRPEELARVAELVRALDVPPRQVLIEARILEADLGREMRLGIDWSKVLTRGEGRGSAVAQGFAGSAGGPGEGLFLAWSYDEGALTAALEAMEGIDELHTLSAPRLVATDGTEAEIIIGDQLGFYVVTTVENTVMQSVEFIDTGTLLRLTPRITSDGHVRVEVHPELSDGAVENGLPSKKTAEVTTDVLLRDGQTLFIGGLIRERDEFTRSGIPLLCRIPIVGALFGRTVRSVQRSELIATVTLRILEPDAQLLPEDAARLGQ